mgnify:CR=1 FL=1
MNAVSVVIPVYNASRTLERAVISVVNDPSVVEVILVEDGSTDNSMNQCYELRDKHSKIHVLKHPDAKNKGASASRNLGISIVQGDWIQFLDADDELLPEKIKKQLELASEKVPFIVGNAIDIFEDGHTHFRKFVSDPWKGLIKGKLGITSANLWNKAFLERVKGWDEKLSSSQEYDLMFRLLQINEKIAFSSQYLTKRYISGDSISTNQKLRQIRVSNWLELRKKIKDYLVFRNRFSLKYRYDLEGTIGGFIEANDVGDTLNYRPTFLHKLYKMELGLKKALWQLREIVKL